jgi:hypothetical protein
MAKENGTNPDLKPVLEAEKALREVEGIAEQRRAELNRAVEGFLAKHGKKVTRTFKNEHGEVKQYETFTLDRVIPTDGGYIELRMRRSSEGKMSGVVLRKNV